MKITYRVPFKMPYAYAEYERDDAVDPPMTDEEFARIAVDAYNMEDAIVAIGGGTGGPTEAAVAHGAQPIPDMGGHGEPEWAEHTVYRSPPARQQQQRPQQRPQRPQAPQQYASVVCDQCGGPTRAGKVIQGKYGPQRPHNCVSGCVGDREDRNGNPYPYTTWVDA